MDFQNGEVWIRAEKDPKGSATWLIGMKYGGDGCIRCGDRVEGKWLKRHSIPDLEGEVVYEVPVCATHLKKLNRRRKWSIIWFLLFFVWFVTGLLLMLIVDPAPPHGAWSWTEWLPWLAPSAFFFIAFLVVVTGEPRHTGFKVLFLDAQQPLCFAKFDDPARAYQAWTESFPDEAGQLRAMQDPNWVPPPPPGGLPEGGWPT